MFAQLTTDHQRDQLLAVVIGHRLDAHQIAVAQYRNALGNPRQLFEAMGNVDDRHAASLQASDLFKQHLDFTGCEHGRRFVEDQHVAIADQVAGDLDHLLVTDAQFADQGVRIDRIETDLSHGFDRRFAQLLATDPAAVAGQVVEKQVFRHRQGRQQIEFLHDHADAEVFRLSAAARSVILPLELHLASGRRDQPTNDLRQRAFARAVLTGQRQHFTAHERQVDAGQDRLGVGLADAADREDSVRVANGHKNSPCARPDGRAPMCRQRITW
ncbi:hypothetical protein D3C71_1023740 [compost metagenome]